MGHSTAKYIIFAVGVVVLVGVITSIGLSANNLVEVNRLKESLARVPESSEDVAVVPADTICTYSVSRLQVVNATCPSVTAFNDTRLFSVCANRTFQRLNPSCWLSSCLTNLTTRFQGVASYSVNFSLGIRFTSLTANDTSPGRIPEMYAKFLASNEPADDTPFFSGSLSLTTPIVFNTSDFLTRNYTIAFGPYARTVLAAVINLQLVSPANAQRLGFSRVMSSLRYLPQNCPETRLRTIPWITSSSTRVMSTMIIASLIPRLREFYNSSLFNATTWQPDCIARVVDGDSIASVMFCRSFPTHYAFESLANPELQPSPHSDLEFLSRLFSDEFDNCRVPRGCTGYVVGTL